MVRGGNFDNEPRNARSAYRNNAQPGDRNDNVVDRPVGTVLKQSRAKAVLIKHAGLNH